MEVKTISSINCGSFTKGTFRRTTTKDYCKFRAIIPVPPIAINLLLNEEWSHTQNSNHFTNFYLFFFGSTVAQIKVGNGRKHKQHRSCDSKTSYLSAQIRYIQHHKGGLIHEFVKMRRFFKGLISKVKTKNFLIGRVLDEDAVSIYMFLKGVQRKNWKALDEASNICS